MKSFTKFWLPAFVIIIGIVVIIGIAARPLGGKQQRASLADHTALITLAGQKVTAQIADTEALRTQGLSGTEPLADHTGMLFVFQTPDLYPFWMKDMKYPIDIIWLDQGQRVVSVKEHATPESYPESFKPTSPALYVLEVSDGFVKKYGVKENMMATLELQAGK
jgi:uncharacterized membrane protein (UPF0127 family)